MMSVSNVVALCKGAKEICIAWNGTIHNINLDDPIVMAAFGDYAVSRICAIGEDKFEIDLDVRPIKVSEKPVCL